MSLDLDQAREFLHLGRYREAAAAAVRHLAEMPDCVDGHSVLAYAQNRLGDTETALDTTARAVKLDPESVPAHYTRAIVLWTAKQLGPAEECLRRAIELDPEDADNFTLLADLLLAMDRPKDALVASKHAIALDPQGVGHRLGKVDVLRLLGRESEADALAAATLALAPDSPEAHRRAAHTALRAGDLPRAGELFLSALRRDPEDTVARRGLLEALRARHGFYRPLLWLRLRLVQTARLSNWVVIPIVAAAFVMAKWVLAPVFTIATVGAMVLPMAFADLSLMRHSIGRHMLRANEKIVAAAVMLFVCATVIFALCFLWSGAPALGRAMWASGYGSVALAVVGLFLSHADAMAGRARNALSVSLCLVVAALVVNHALRNG